MCAPGLMTLIRAISSPGEGSRPRAGAGCWPGCSQGTARRGGSRGCCVGTGVAPDPARWTPAGDLSPIPAAERGQPAVADPASSAAEERCPRGPAPLPGKGNKHIPCVPSLRGRLALPRAQGQQGAEGALLGARCSGCFACTMW